MDVQADRDAFFRGLQMANNVVEPRQTLPILANILLEGDGETACVTATDLEVGARVTIPAKVASKGAVTVSARKLAEIVKELPADDILDRKPLIDRYGQWIPENWENKAHTDAQLRSLWEKDKIEPGDYPFCPLGGDPSRSVKREPYFRTAQVDGRWFLVDPHGHPFFSTGVDLVGYDSSSYATNVERREFLFEELPPEGPAWLAPGKVISFYIANIVRRFGNRWREEWPRHIVSRLKGWGFNTIANWSSPEIAKNSGMPYTLPLSGWTTRKMFPFPYDFPDVFSAEFESTVDAAARRQCAPFKDDPNLIGWFIGNEPRWARSFGALQSWPDMLLADPEPSATRAKVE